jgi:hypothetical protein
MRNCNRRHKNSRISTRDPLPKSLTRSAPDPPAPSPTSKPGGEGEPSGFYKKNPGTFPGFFLLHSPQRKFIKRETGLAVFFAAGRRLGLVALIAASTAGFAGVSLSRLDFARCAARTGAITTLAHSRIAAASPIRTATALHTARWASAIDRLYSTIQARTCEYNSKTTHDQRSGQG